VDTVARAEAFVSAVEQVFALQESSISTNLENDNPDQGSRVSEPNHAVGRMETSFSQSQPFSLEEERRQARENWLRYRQQKVEGATDIDHELGTGGNAKEELSHTPDNDLDR
jgi:hypothetical protein